MHGKAGQTGTGVLGKLLTVTLTRLRSHLAARGPALVHRYVWSGCQCAFLKRENQVLIFKTQKDLCKPGMVTHAREPIRLSIGPAWDR